MSDDCCPLITRFTVQIQRKIHFPWLYMVNFVREVLNKMINEWIKLGIIIKNKGINMGFM